jgi:hypothetical protein
MSCDPATLAAAFVAGLVGSAHCLGMCGGIAAGLGMGTAGPDAGAGRALAYALVYNAGRIASYAVAGAIAGGVGLAFGQVLHAPDTLVVLRLLTGAVLVAIGLQVAFNLRLLRPLERMGMHAWRRIAPLARGLMHRRGLLGALALGGLWGWLPCGLVYGILLSALVTGDPFNAALMMAAFGLGTAPAMVATGALGTWFRRLSADRRFRMAAGGVVIAMGLWTALSPVAMMQLHAGHGGA